MCGQHNVRATARGNTDRTQTNDTHTVPGYNNKIPNSAVSNPGYHVGKQGFYRPCHSDGFFINIPQDSDMILNLNSVDTNLNLILNICLWNCVIIRHRGVVGRVPAFQPGDPGSIPGGVRNFNFCLGIGCVSIVFCPSAEALTLCWPHIQWVPPFCICLVFWARDCCSHYRHLTHGHLACKSLGCKS